jgi:UDP-N-acetylmuramoyl-tripeptide--D-alanyl-D-alanine ligase
VPKKLAKMKIEDLYHIYKECGAISTDSRKLIPGSVFFALKGDNFNGNRFALEAIGKSCAYAVVDDPNLPPHDRLIQFPDALEALQSLAKYHRSQLNIPFIGITGSNGKTTTKELIAAVLGKKYKVCATIGNLNNHIGVPLTVLSVKDHDIAIIEMGANHIGEIANLCSIADPDSGMITNIGKAHLEGFGTPEGVIIAKSELYDHLAYRNSKVFVDGGNPLLAKLSNEKRLNAVFYGNHPHSECTGEINDSSRFLHATINIVGIKSHLTIHSSLVGDYNLPNLLAAACIGRYFGVPSDDISVALNEYTPSNSRSQLLVTALNKVVMDAYNANPSSMESSILNFLSLKEDLTKMMILGDMLELGSYSKAEHKSIIDLLTKKEFKNFFLVGPEFTIVSESLQKSCYKKVEDLIEHFRLNPVKDHCILLKGSRGIRLEKLMEVL